MSSMIARALEAVGTEFTLFSDRCPDGRLCRGVFQPLSVRAESSRPIPLPPGVCIPLRCALTAPPYAIVPGESGVTVLCLGVRYALSLAVPRFLGDELSHWEASLRFLRLENEAQEGAEEVNAS